MMFYYRFLFVYFMRIILIFMLRQQKKKIYLITQVFIRIGIEKILRKKVEKKVKERYVVSCLRGDTKKNPQPLRVTIPLRTAS